MIFKHVLRKYSRIYNIKHFSSYTRSAMAFKKFFTAALFFAFFVDETLR